MRIYDGSGVQIEESQVGNIFGFTAREFDSESHLYYYRARYYDSKLGRFISEDPIGFGGGDSNFYRYVQNRAIVAKDPSGSIPLLPIVADLIVTAVEIFNGAFVICLAYEGCLEDVSNITKPKPEPKPKPKPKIPTVPKCDPTRQSCETQPKKDPEPKRSCDNR